MRRPLRVLAFAALTVSTGCTWCPWQSPQYYRSKRDVDLIKCRDSCLCFDIRPYLRAGMSCEDVYHALARAGSSFAGPYGVYHALFTAGCTEEQIKDEVQTKIEECLRAESTPTPTSAASKQVPGPTKSPRVSSATSASAERAHVHISFFTQPVPSSEAAAETEKADGGDAGKEDANHDTKNKKAKVKANKKSEANRGAIDPTKGGTSPSSLVKHVQVVISAYLYSLEPSNRLEKVYTLITPIDPSVEFIATSAVRVPTTVASGDLTTGGEVGFQLGTPATAPMSASVAPKLSSSLQRKIERQYTTLNSEIFPLRNVLLISEDGGPARADIAGNSVIDVLIRIPANPCDHLTVFEHAGSAGPFKSHHRCYTERVPAVMTSLAVARVVVKGGTTVSEEDDEIEWEAFRSATISDLWTNDEAFYGVDVGGAGVVFANRAGREERLLFSQLDDAVEFRNWLLNQIDLGHTLQRTGKPMRWNGDVTIGFSRDIPSIVPPASAKVCRFGKPAPNRGTPSLPAPRDLCLYLGDT